MESTIFQELEMNKHYSSSVIKKSVLGMIKFPEQSVHKKRCSFDQLIRLLCKDLKMNKKLQVQKYSSQPLHNHEIFASNPSPIING